MSISRRRKKLYDILSGEPVHVDTLSRELSLPTATTLTILFGLEIKGIVRQADGKRLYLVC